jgi:opacity protein-like surface antigen
VDSDALNSSYNDAAVSNSPPAYSYASQGGESYSTPVSSVTGFYGGADVGMSRLKNKVTKRNRTEVKVDTSKTETIVIVQNKSKTKSGALWDIFCGYNFQIGKFIVGAEVLVGMASPKPRVFTKGSKTEEEESTTSIESTTLKRKYSFGLVPRIGYNIIGGFNAYLNFGTTFSKYNVNFKSKEKKKDGDEKKVKKGKTKAALLLGLGAEQNFGPFFVRAECNKVFKKRIVEIEKEKVNANSYIFKVGGGCRF